MENHSGTVRTGARIQSTPTMPAPRDLSDALAQLSRPSSGRPCRPARPLGYQVRLIAPSSPLLTPSTSVPLSLPPSRLHWPRTDLHKYRLSSSSSSRRAPLTVVAGVVTTGTRHAVLGIPSLRHHRGILGSSSLVRRDVAAHHQRWRLHNLCILGLGRPLSSLRPCWALLDLTPYGRAYGIIGDAALERGGGGGGE